MSFQQKFKELIQNQNAAQQELSAVINDLLKDGADPSEIVTNGRNAVSLAIDRDKWEIVEYFLSKDFNRSMIFAGIECLSPLMIDYLESKYVKVPHELKSDDDLDWINQIN